MAKLDDLKIEADKLGVQYAPNISFMGLQKLIKQKKAETNNSKPAPSKDKKTKEEKENKKPLKPLNKTAFPDKKVNTIVYTEKPKKCAGNNSSYIDTPDNFPKYKTAKGVINTYSKDFLDDRVNKKMLIVEDGIYTAK